MKVQDLMSSRVLTCAASEPLSAAARIMWEHDCGCVPVVSSEGILVGIVTDRDVCMAAYTQGRPIEAIPVHVAMAKSVQSISAADSVEKALKLMSERQVRRLPVVDHWHRVVGIVSLADLARHAPIKERAAVAAAVAAISLPRTEPAPATKLRPAKVTVTRTPALRRASASGRSAYVSREAD